MGFAILSGAGLIHGLKDTSNDKSANGEAASVAAAITAAETKITGFDDSTIVAGDFSLTNVGETGTESRVVSDFLYTLTITHTDTSVYTWSASKTAVNADYQLVHVHKTIAQEASNSVIDLSEGLATNDTICDTAPIFIMETEEDGSITGVVYKPPKDNINSKSISTTGISGVEDGTTYLVDFYVTRPSNTVYELQINAEDFAGSYYVEAETLFRRQDTGADLPAIFTLPNVKIQSNWTFSMSADGDPSEQMRLAA